MDNAQKKLVIITASVLLHAITLFVILVLYHQPAHDLFAFDPSQAIDITETIFYDPPSHTSTPETPEPTSVFDNWAQLNPRASTLGTSMEMPDGPIGPEIPDEMSQDENGSNEVIEADTDLNESETAAGENQNALEFNSQIRISEELVEPPTAIKSGLNSETSSTKTMGKKARSQARKALAGITQGYLQQLKDEGENLIKTLGGDPNKKPTAEQLKYERYLAKIQWCLQNAHSINQEKCQLHEPIESIMRIYFVLNREGKMTGFKIMQSSGKAYVDQYISSLFQFASSSFPPLPAYVKEDHLPLTYTVLVNWNTGSHMGFSRY